MIWVLPSPSNSQIMDTPKYGIVRYRPEIDPLPEARTRCSYVKTHKGMILAIILAATVATPGPAL